MASRCCDQYYVSAFQAVSNSAAWIIAGNWYPRVDGIRLCGQLFFFEASTGSETRSFFSVHFRPLDLMSFDRLYGISVLQAYLYYRNYHSDHPVLKGTVRAPIFMLSAAKMSTGRLTIGTGHTLHDFYGPRSLYAVCMPLRLGFQ